jgi:hypothetical protein
MHVGEEVRLSRSSDCTTDRKYKEGLTGVMKQMVGRLG